MKNPYTLSLFLTLLMLCWGCAPKPIAEVDYTQYVDPLIGTGGHGHVFVGASVPHGMVQLGPNNATKGWDWCSGYHHSDSTIIGFAHTHLSGTGIADLGDISFMPVSEVNLATDTNFVSTFLKEQETATPGYYAVHLLRYGIDVEVTASERVGWHRYRFPKGKEAQVIIDMEEAVKSLMFRKGTIDSYLQVINDTTVVGYRLSDEWAKDHRIYFAARFSSPATSNTLYLHNTAVDRDSIGGDNVKGSFYFNGTEELLVKVALSYTSVEGAIRNLAAETTDWDFDAITAQARNKWNESLSVVDYQTSDENQKKLFYTALYHTQISPSLFSDVDGAYRGADGKVYQKQQFTPYTIFSLWDTYRAVHPWFTLVDTKTSDYINTLIDITEKQGRLPVWHLAGNETDCMTGMHSVPVIVDATLKNIAGIDPQRAYQAVVGFASTNYGGLPLINQYGYIPADKEMWSVAKGLEYCIDDYAVAQLAQRLGQTADYERYMARSKGYAHYFDTLTGFMRGRLANGAWRTPFNPSHSIHLEDDYVEGNAWQYTWLVPHDVEGLIALFGGEESFIQKFDSLFTVSSALNEGASVDITGMIGQYAHGNEPSHHILYLYAFAGKQWRTAQEISKVYNQFYKITPDGLIGNEDCGQMSTWYIFSSLGFYPVNPVNGMYVFGTPLAEKATIRLANGKEFVVRSLNSSPSNRYIQSVKLNDILYPHSYIMHEDIMKGGELVFTMGETPNYSFGKLPQHRPYSNSKLNNHN